MLKILLASLIIGSTSTVSVVELYNWNALKLKASSESTPIISHSYTIDGTSAYMEKNRHYIKYLKMEIDSMDNIRVLEESNVQGEWVKRSKSIGPKIYYEINDVDGKMIDSGYRSDPRRNYFANDIHKSVPFVLSIPYYMDAKTITFYTMNDSGENSTVGINYVKLFAYNFQTRI